MTKEEFHTISLVIDAKDQIEADRIKSSIVKFLQTQQGVKLYVANVLKGYLVSKP